MEQRAPFVFREVVASVRLGVEVCDGETQFDALRFDHSTHARNDDVRAEFFAFTSRYRHRLAGVR